MRVPAMMIAAGLAVSSFAYSPASYAGVDQLVASMCDYVKADDKKRLRKKLKENRVKIRAIYDGVSCDGQSLLRTAMTANANDVGVFLVKRMPKGELKKPEADGSTALQWAQANGHGGSAIGTALVERTQ